MSFRSKTAAGVLVLVALATVGRAFSADPAEPPRPRGQAYNRMVCIQTEGKANVYVDMPGHWDLGSPAISPDGKTVAFDALTTGERPVRETWTVGVDGKGLRKVTDAAVPRWSPDGKRLFVTRNVPPEDRSPSSQFLFEVDVATGTDRQVCAGRFGDWSPDGKRIALARGGERTLFNSGIYPQSSLLTVNVDGSDERQIGPGDWPTWSPDGKKLAFSISEQGIPPALWIVDVATLKRDRLGVGFYRAQWAGDGKTVVSNGLMLAENGRSRRAPARYWLDGSRMEFFCVNYDNPFSPCVSRDGKTITLIVDSKNLEERGR